MAEKSKPILLPKGKRDDTKDDEDSQDAQSPAIADITVQPDPCSIVCVKQPSKPRPMERPQPET